VQVQRFKSATHFYLRQEIQAAANAAVEFLPVYLGGASGQLRLATKLLGADASATVLGAARASQKQHFDFWVDMEHSVANTRSALDFWFVMDDQARAVFNGLIKIGKHAPQTDAYQKCKTLLLSDKAQVNAIPKLIIQTDAVKCAHGASITSVQPEQVHYLQSRGITAAEATRMIVRGFTESVTEKLPTIALYERVEQLIAAKEHP
jgi:Fe-S cluster assembly protein SufD